MMSEKRILKGIARSKGIASGEALVSDQPLSWAPFTIPNETGIISMFGHKLTGRRVKDKIVVYPTVTGSTVGSIGLYFKVKESKVGPSAIICRQVHPIDLGGAIAAEIPAVDSLDGDPIQEIKTGDWVEIKAIEVGKEATVTITRKA
jgi:predicted aconitase with swiveling domain